MPYSQTGRQKLQNSLRHNAVVGEASLRTVNKTHACQTLFLFSLFLRPTGSHKCNSITSRGMLNSFSINSTCALNWCNLYSKD
uniref:Uncharacterized protein n=1 Tax=Anguilla anguilla TaxID=7936 RepID=A0A0E9U542_ANGAN